MVLRQIVRKYLPIVNIRKTKMMIAPVNSMIADFYPSVSTLLFLCLYYDTPLMISSNQFISYCLAMAICYSYLYFHAFVRLFALLICFFAFFEMGLRDFFTIFSIVRVNSELLLVSTLFTAARSFSFSGFIPIVCFTIFFSMISGFIFWIYLSKPSSMLVLLNDFIL
ncbi:hypothetical protein SAMN05444360_104106 [Chryseobacterium carnipullorum]|nr:hypothetical protein SAMN05444360_104106 [Chryseobacterium carnipullorum]